MNDYLVKAVISTYMYATNMVISVACLQISLVIQYNHDNKKKSIHNRWRLLLF